MVFFFLPFLFTFCCPPSLKKPFLIGSLLTLALASNFRYEQICLTIRVHLVECNITINIFFLCTAFSILHHVAIPQIILTVAEHHSNIVPWQLVAQKVGAVLKFVDLNQDEAPDIDKLKEMITTKTKLVVVHHVSNVLGMFFISSFHHEYIF